MKTDTKPAADQTLSMRVAGEDLRAGDFVATFSQVYEVPSYMWDCGDYSLSPHELVRLNVIPPEAGTPLKIIGVSLPFVYALTPSGRVETLDTRRIQLVRLASDCAKMVWKRMAPRKRTGKNSDRPARRR